MGHFQNSKILEHFEDFGGVVLPGMGFMDMFAVLLQGGKAHLALFGVIRIFNVCCPETQQRPERVKESRGKKKEKN